MLILFKTTKTTTKYSVYFFFRFDILKKDLSNSVIWSLVDMVKKKIFEKVRPYTSRIFTNKQNTILLGLERLAYEHRDLLKEQETLRVNLKQHQGELPQAYGIMISDKRGFAVADEVQGQYTPINHVNPWARLAALQKRLPEMMTPAQRLRRKYVRMLQNPTVQLSGEEREWIILDFALFEEKVKFEFNVWF